MVTTKYRWLIVHPEYNFIQGTNEKTTVDVALANEYIVVDLMAGQILELDSTESVVSLPIECGDEINAPTSQIPLIASDENPSSGEPQPEQK